MSWFDNFLSTWNKNRQQQRDITSNQVMKNIYTRRGLPKDEMSLRKMGYDKYGESLLWSGGNFGAAGAGWSWDTDSIEKDDPEYIRNLPIYHQRSFSEAFKDAKDKNLDTFMFNNKMYTTEVSENPKYSKAEYEKSPLMVLRQILDSNHDAIEDSTRVEPYIGQLFGEFKRDKLKIKK